MDASVAHRVARRIHTGQSARSGEPLIDHVERVARAVPARDRALAYLHDVLEHQDRAMDELREHGLTDIELGVLALLTRGRTESYARYVMRIARADGRQGRIAREIKRADLEDHLRHRRPGGRAPNYAWAQQQIVAAQRARRERPPSAQPGPGRKASNGQAIGAE